MQKILTHTGRELKFDGKTFAPINTGTTSNPSFCLDEVLALTKIAASARKVAGSVALAAWETLRKIADDEVLVSNAKALGAINALVNAPMPKNVKAKWEQKHYEYGAKKMRELLAA
jgi:2-hydroxychromene-2-carboxylate isomerase